jgi:hypothetical protein
MEVTPTNKILLAGKIDSKQICSFNSIISNFKLSFQTSILNLLIVAFKLNFQILEFVWK